MVRDDGGLDQGLMWQEGARDVVLQDGFITITTSSYALPDGTEFGPYYVYSTKDSVTVIPVTDDGRIVCVRQFRPGVARVITELPAGAIDPSDMPSGPGDADMFRRAACRAAARELREETGYVSDDLTYLGSTPLHATVCRDVNHCVLARGCKLAGSQSLDPTEFMHVLLVTPQDLDEMVLGEGGFMQLSHAYWWLRFGSLARTFEGGSS